MIYKIKLKIIHRLSMPFNFGAKNKLTGEIVSPSNATQGTKYLCISCNKSVILKKGKIIQPYFSHLKNESCILYGENSKEKENIDESPIHLYAKNLIKYILENSIKFYIQRKCRKCDNYLKFEFEELYSEDFFVELEYYFVSFYK